jgi:hypothetical protein
VRKVKVGESQLVLTGNTQKSDNFALTFHVGAVSVGRRAAINTPKEISRGI